MAEKTNTPLEKEKSLSKTEVSGREITRNPDSFMAPPVDIYETKDALIVVTDLPGISKESLEVKVEEDVLTIEGKMTHAFHKDPLYREIEPINFFRQFELADSVNPEKIVAELKHGVLTLTLPWKEKARPRQIKVDIA